MAILLDGKKLAQLVEEDLRNAIARAKFKRQPGLGVILVGEDPASQAYVATKEKVAKRAGLLSFESKLPKDATSHDVRAAITRMNEDARVDGILMQLPLPKHLKSDDLIDLIEPNKDADGLHSLNQGLLMRGLPSTRPCTPLGAMKLIDLALGASKGNLEQVKFSEISAVDLKGKHAVVIGRSILVGKPVALLLLERNATVTVVHSKTVNPEKICATADIVVAAVGVPGLVQAEWIKPGAVVIDVGINRTKEGKLVGDVNFDSAEKRAGFITPVPGGVGPMTVAMLIYNTYKNFEKKMKE